MGTFSRAPNLAIQFAKNALATVAFRLFIRVAFGQCEKGSFDNGMITVNMYMFESRSR